MWPSSCRTVEQATPSAPQVEDHPLPDYSVMFGSASTSNGILLGPFTAGDPPRSSWRCRCMPRGRHRHADALAPELLDHHLAQMRISRDAAADAVFLASGGVRSVLGLLVLNVKDCGLKRSRQVRQMHRTPGFGLLLNVERHGRLKARKRESIVSYCGRTGEVNRAVARLSQFGNDGTARIAQTSALATLSKASPTASSSVSPSTS